MQIIGVTSSDNEFYMRQLIADKISCITIIVNVFSFNKK